MILSILTPMSHFFEEEIKSVALQTVDGRIVIMPRYTPYVTGLVNGVAKIETASGETKHVACMKGFVEVTDNKVTILTDDAHWPDDIDEKRAIEAKERANARLKETQDIDRARALDALTRAEIRLKLQEYK